LQDAVCDGNRSSCLRKPLVTEPVDVNGEKQKADRPHEIRDFGQAAQIVFFLHDHYCPVKAGKSVFEIVET